MSTPDTETELDETGIGETDTPETIEESPETVD
jgi:hypothetical protein